MAAIPGRLVATAQNHNKDSNSVGLMRSGQTVQVRIDVHPRPQQDVTVPRDWDGNVNGHMVDVRGGDSGVDRSVKIPEGKLRTRSTEDDEEAVMSAGEESSAHEDTESSDESSEAENEWEGESDRAEEVEEEVVDANTCVFCGEDEEHDPGEEFEEYLACSVCGDNAHRHCARTARSLAPDSDAKHWRCVGCIENGLERTQNNSESPSHRRSSVPKLARDLLPAQRGAKPDSYSIFDQLIVDDNAENGSRLLRKRKASDEAEESGKVEGKRKRQKSESSVVPESPSRLKRRTTSVVAGVNGKHDSTVAADEVAITDDDTPGTRPARSRRLRKVEKPLVRMIQTDDESLVLAFALDSTKLAKIVGPRPRRRDRDRKRDRSRKIMAPPEEISHYPAIHPSTFAIPFPSFHDKESDDLKSKPYGGILTDVEADTSRTFPQAADRKRFEEARQKAEDDWKQKTANAISVTENPRASQKVSGPPSKIKCINFGGYEIDTWHAAPYPEEYSRNKILYICEFCLKYMSSDFVAWRHKLKCPAKHPPGDEIYRDGNFSFFEVDGRKNPVYCQNLCLLAKLFLGSKTLYYDVEPFLFYVMTEYDEYGYHFVGYFSKEKRPSSQNNVSCILVLPIHQRRGFGHLLIDFSYLLTRVERKTGSPEKPLSDMGLVSYRSYWRLILCYQLINQTRPLSIPDLSERTGMTTDDIISALEGLRALVRDPVTKTYALRLDYAYFKEYIENYERKGYVKLDPDALVWTPYVMGRNSQAQYEDAPPLHTMAPRDEDEEGPQPQPEEGVQLAVREELDAKTETNGEAREESVPTAEPESVPKSPYTRGNALRTTPGPPSLSSFPTADSRGSPSKRRSQSRGLPVATPAPNSIPTSPSPIPPTRFEVFPPIPGTVARRRNGRPSRGGNRRTATPIRRGGKMFGSPAVQNASASASVRRTRSTLGESTEVAANEDRDEEDKEDEDGVEAGAGEGEKEEAEEDAADAEGEEDDSAPKAEDAAGDEDADGEEEYIPPEEEEAEGEDVAMEGT